MKDDMTMELSTQAYIAALAGGNGAGNSIANNAANTETNESDDQFARYLMAIKGAKLSETQLQKLSESRADDERTRTIEKLDRQAKADDDHYNKKRSNGYTVGETRRGVDQVDRAVERKTAEAQRDAAHEKSLQKADASQGGNRRNTFVPQTPGNTASNDTAGLHSPTTRGTIIEATMSELNANAIVSQTQTMRETAAHIASNDAAQTLQNINGEQAGGNVAESVGSANGSNVAKQVDMTVAQSPQQQAVKVGKSTAASMAASMAAVMSAMTPVSRNTNAKFDAELDANAAKIGQNADAKQSVQDTLTQEALTAASQTQQSDNDIERLRQRQTEQWQSPQEQAALSQQNATAGSNAGEAAASQTLPGMSLLDRVDRAKLSNRVASAFRSLANQSGTIRMKLHPEELGALTIRMQIESGKVAAKLEAETESARQVLTENIDALKRKLKEQNLEVTSFEIEVVAGREGGAKRSVKSSTEERPGLQSVSQNAASSRKNKGETESQQTVDRVDYYS